MSGYLFTSMHLSHLSCATGLLRKTEGELEKQHAFILVVSDRAGLTANMPNNVTASEVDSVMMNAAVWCQ